MLTLTDSCLIIPQNIYTVKSANLPLHEKGYDENYGARPLNRLIQKEVENPLALKILSGEFQEGDTVTLDVKNGQLTLKKKD